MPDPSLTKPLARLTEVVARLHEASDSLNAMISELEAILVKLDPGLTVWCDKPVRLVGTFGSQVGFTRVKDRWGLWIRRGEFVKDNDAWKPVPEVDWNFVRLVHATRSERAAAVKQLPGFVEEMSQAAEEQLAALERATKLAR
jgi:hypothetical protein